MKKILLAATFIFMVGAGVAQNNKVISTNNYLKSYGQDPVNSAEDLLKAKDNIDAAKEHPKTMNAPKTHNYLGQTYQQLYLAEADQFKAFKNLEVLKTSVDAFNFAIENADRRTDVAEIKRFQGLNADLSFKAGISYYQNREFAKAAELFSMRENIMSTHFDRIDTISIFNVGLCAEQTENYDLAIEKYQRCAELGYNGGGMYASIAGIQQKQGDVEGALATLKEGREKYPDEVALLTQEINIFLKEGKIDDALNNLNMAIEKEPNNDSYYFARGTLFDKKGSYEKAMEDYKKAIGINPDNFDANYNLGAMYVNQSGQVVEEMNADLNMEQEKYDKLKTKLEGLYKKAVPYLEQAHNLNPKDQATMQTLVELYVKTGDTEKYKAMKAKLQGQ